jgi:hypothetical protein
MGVLLKFIYNKRDSNSYNTRGGGEEEKIRQN